jgi:hypothetical protein
VRLLLGDELARGLKAERGQRVDITLDYWLE